VSREEKIPRTEDKACNEISEPNKSVSLHRQILKTSHRINCIFNSNFRLISQNKHGGKFCEILNLFYFLSKAALTKAICTCLSYVISKFFSFLSSVTQILFPTRHFALLIIRNLLVWYMHYRLLGTCQNMTVVHFTRYLSAYGQLHNSLRHGHLIFHTLIVHHSMHYWHQLAFIVRFVEKNIAATRPSLV
jgi:hypothetical protein